jgi:enoyl-CoA hydratase/carnithine racemase
LDLDGPCATVTLDNPDRRNAQTPATWARLAEIGNQLPDSVRVVLLRANGPSFSAGLDRSVLTGKPTDAKGTSGGADSPASTLAALRQMSTAELDQTLARFQSAFTWWQRPGLLSIAAVAGHAVGAGFQLALACHLRVVADDALFAMRETTLGLVPDLTGTQRLVAAVGEATALELCLTGRWLTAEEAVARGLAVRAVPREELDDAAADLATAILSSPAGAVTETIDLLMSARHRTTHEQWQAEREAQQRLLGKDPA